MAVLNGICDRQLGQPLLASQLLAGLGDVDSAAPSTAMWHLSRQATAAPAVAAVFNAGPHHLADRLRAAATEHPDAAAWWSDFEGFLDRFGSRGPNEWDTAFDTWETDPNLALVLIDRLRGADDSHDPTSQGQRLAAEAAAAEAAGTARLEPPARGLFRMALRSARLHSRARERSKTTVVRAIHGARLQAMELDRRLVERSGGQKGDLWFLVDPEIDAYLADPAAHRELIAERRAQHARLAERIPRSSSPAANRRWRNGSCAAGSCPRYRWARSSPGCPAVPARPGAGPGWSPTRPIPGAWPRATCWWRPSPIRRGRRCSWRPRRWWSTWGR